MPYSQKYTLVHFKTPLPVGATFTMSEWPPHITLADVFAIDRAVTCIDQHLAALTTKSQPVTIAATRPGVLGETSVVLFKNTFALQQLHDSIIDLLGSRGAVFNHPEFTKTGFLPHSNTNTSTPIHPGDTLHITSLSLIDMYPDSDWQQRKVLATFMLGS